MSNEALEPQPAISVRIITATDRNGLSLLISFLIVTCDTPAFIRLDVACHLTQNNILNERIYSNRHPEYENPRTIDTFISLADSTSKRIHLKLS